MTFRIRTYQRMAGTTTSLEVPPADFARDVAEANGLPANLATERFTTPLVFSAPGTADRVVDGTKDVTRRIAGRLDAARWRVGAPARAYRKSPRTGAQPFGVVRLVDVHHEFITEITAAEVTREGFPGMSVEGFLALFRTLHAQQGQQWPWKVWRIEFKYVCALGAQP